MKPLRSFLDRLEPLFTKGGRFEGLYALFEAVDTFFYSPGDLTRGSPHVRDAIDLKRVMIIVVFAATPAALIGMWNVGFQTHTAMASLGIEWVDGWRGSMMANSARDPYWMAEAARMVEANGAKIIDINMGCPAKKVCNKLAGSALLSHPGRVRAILRAVVDAVDVPVTLKIRTGPNPLERNGVEIAGIAEEEGIAALAVALIQRG